LAEESSSHLVGHRVELPLKVPLHYGGKFFGFLRARGGNLGCAFLEEIGDLTRYL
jgi:hypothetical protein